MSSGHLLLQLIMISRSRAWCTCAHTTLVILPGTLVTLPCVLQGERVYTVSKLRVGRASTGQVLPDGIFSRRTFATGGATMTLSMPDFCFRDTIANSAQPHGLQVLIVHAHAFFILFEPSSLATSLAVAGAVINRRLEALGACRAQIISWQERH